MTDKTVTIEINGVPVEATAGQMLIEVTDREDAYVPRFCYHEKLSVAANCRMCLVEVEKAPKPLPACATPVMDGMKVFTRSAVAIAAKKATMEFCSSITLSTVPSAIRAVSVSFRTWQWDSGATWLAIPNESVWLKTRISGRWCQRT